MDRNDFGKLVAALRKELRDEKDRSWTQKRLGEETGLGEVVVGKIERGQRTNLDPDTLSRLANALRLMTCERKEFFVAAVGVDDDQMARTDRDPKDVVKDMLRMIERIRLPAFIVDGYGDIIAANTAVARLFGISPDLAASASTQPAGHNVMRAIFAPESSARYMWGRRWPEYAVYNIGFFRCITLRHRFTDYFALTLSQLRKYPLFRQFWQRVHFEQDDYYASSEQYQYEHPKYGAVEYLATLSTTLTTSGELYLVTYVPASARTAGVFAGLIDEGGTTLLRLASWPEKTFPTS